MSYCILLAFCFALALGGALVYFKVALRHGPFAMPNFRSLHRAPVPRGGGLAVAVAVLAAAAGMRILRAVPPGYVAVYLAGGLVIALLGVADDRWDLSAGIRLPGQVLAAFWVSYWLGGFDVVSPWLSGVPLILADGLLIVALVWFYNLYNFIDGIDGLAASATVFLGTTMGLILLGHGLQVLAGLCGFLAVASAAFLFFNWPPAKMFMGEAGSSFTSFMFSGICVESLRAEPTLIWYWLLAGAFYFSDTTLTTLTRLLTVPGWYRPHRSHAYQNMARVLGSHRKVLLLVMLCNLCWILPLLMAAWVYPHLTMILTVAAYVPIAIFCFKYGPRFENK